MAVTHFVNNDGVLCGVVPRKNALLTTADVNKVTCKKCLKKLAASAPVVEEPTVEETVVEEPTESDEDSITEDDVDELLDDLDSEDLEEEEE